MADSLTLMEPEAWLALLGVLVAGGLATLTWARRTEVTPPVAAGLMLQGAITVALYLVLGLWAPDAEVYDRIGLEFAASWRGGPPPSLVTDGKEAFPLLLGAVYYTVGHAPAIGLAINWVAHGLLIVTMATLARRAALPVRPTAWIVALAPPVLLWSSLLLRETITWLLMALFLHALLGIARRLNLRDAVLMVLTLVSLMWFRGTAAIVMAGAGMAAMVLTANRRAILPRLGIVALAVAVLAPRLGALLVGYTSIAGIEEKRDILTGTADTSFDPIGGDGVVARMLDSAARVAFGPYPWEWLNVGAPLAFDAVVWLTIIGLAALGWWRAPNRRELLLLVLPALALTAALMITSGNYGTMQRLRVQTSVLLVPLAAAGLVLVVAGVRARRPARTSGPTTDPTTSPTADPAAPHDSTAPPR